MEIQYNHIVILICVQASCYAGQWENARLWRESFCCCQKLCF